MSNESRRFAGILLLTLPTVMFGGATVLSRIGAPVAAILIPAAFFLSVASPTATAPSGLINLAYAGAATLASSVVTLGVGLVRAPRA